MGKTLIPEHYAVVIAYLSGWAPIGTEFDVNITLMAEDLGYSSRATVYQIIKQLRKMGVVKHVKANCRTGFTSMICYAREEQFTIAPRGRGQEQISLRVRKGEDLEPRLPRGRPKVVKPLKSQPKKKLISYVGKERRGDEEWSNNGNWRNDDGIS